MGFSWVMNKKIYLSKCTDICDLLMKQWSGAILKCLITVDEKWIVHNNVNQKSSCSKPGEPAKTTSKTDIHQQKVMLTVWWGHKGTAFFEILSCNQVINSNVYSWQKMNHTLTFKLPQKKQNQKAIQLEIMCSFNLCWILIISTRDHNLCRNSIKLCNFRCENPIMTIYFNFWTFSLNIPKRVIRSISLVIIKI